MKVDITLCGDNIDTYQTDPVCAECRFQEYPVYNEVNYIYIYR